jgi:hypothetical protein
MPAASARGCVRVTMLDCCAVRCVRNVLRMTVGTHRSSVSELDSARRSASSVLGLLLTGRSTFVHVSARTPAGSAASLILQTQKQNRKHMSRCRDGNPCGARERVFAHE